MVTNVYSAPHELTGPKFAAAFAEGAGGLPIIEDAIWQPGAWAGFGSPYHWHTLTETRKRGGTWYYGDHAYFNRFEYYRITRNAFQHSGLSDDAVLVTGLPRDMPDFAPWRTDGRFVLVCPPSEDIAALRGFDRNDWMKSVMSRLLANSDRPIKTRDRRSDAPLLADLSDAWAVVTWASNVAIDALIAGVPVFVTDDCAARPMGLSDPVNIEYPVYPDNRREWLQTLAANQFTLDEIRSGLAWAVVNG